MSKSQTIVKTYDPSKLVGFTPSATKKLENVFGSFDDILAALAPKPVDRARLRNRSPGTRGAIVGGYTKRAARSTRRGKSSRGRR
jgi:hypothetical protein